MSRIIPPILAQGLDQAPRLLSWHHGAFPSQQGPHTWHEVFIIPGWSKQIFLKGRIWGKSNSTGYRSFTAKCLWFKKCVPGIYFWPSAVLSTLHTFFKIYFLFFNLGVIALQGCIGFCRTTTQISHNYVYMCMNIYIYTSPASWASFPPPPIPSL